MRNYSKRKSKYPLRIEGRISESRYTYLVGLVAQSKGLTMNEVIRNILENKPVKLRYQKQKIPIISYLFYRQFNLTPSV
ncbi:hypothetical protein [Algoriphagus aquimarinus]|uniref:hypothetical protein n=1 Tax=Algoriphagus aquimarinus TaxID=237018 RepID=UPI0030DA52FC